MPIDDCRGCAAAGAAADRIAKVIRTVTGRAPYG
jgi:hypothetical protein